MLTFLWFTYLLLRHVVPSHYGLLVKYQGHINIEQCNRSLSIKYLFKYIGKGPDTTTIQLEKGSQHLPNIGEASTSLKRTSFDEVNNYISCRYVSAAESCRHLFQFPIHHREPFVQRLYFYLENEQKVRFHDKETLLEVVRRVDPDGTMFIKWMLNNQCDELGRDLTLLNTLQSFVGMYLLKVGFVESKMSMLLDVWSMLTQPLENDSTCGYY